MSLAQLLLMSAAAERQRAAELLQLGSVLGATLGAMWSKAGAREFTELQRHLAAVANGEQG